MSKLILDTPTHQIRVPDDAVIGQAPIRVITTQAFFRRMTPAERKVLRTSAIDEVKDLREDLQRSAAVDLDGTIEQQLLDTTLVSQARIDELLVDGVQAET